MRLIGQILPCPKCGSMVLIERPAKSVEELASGPAASFAIAIASDLPPRDSFDNIDQLFDEPLRIVDRPRASSRWRVAGQGATPRPTASEAAPSGTPRVAPIAASVAADRDLRNETTPVEATAPAIVTNREPFVPKMPSAEHHVGWRRSRWLAVGVTAGIIGSLGVVGYLTFQDGSPAVVEKPADASPRDFEPTAPSDTVTSAPDPQALPTVVNNSNEVAPDGADPRNEPEPGAPIAASDITSSELPSLPRSNETASVVETPPLPASPPEEQAAAAETPNVSPPTPAANPGETTAPTGDDLADFARWLQSPGSAPLSAAPANGDNNVTSPTPTNPPPPDVHEETEAAVPAVLATRSPAPLVDVAARLREPISAISFEDVPLHRALRVFTEITTVPVRLKPEVLRFHNIRANKPIKLTVRDGRGGDLLSQLVAAAKLRSLAKEGYVEIVTTDSDEIVTKSHDVSDFSDSDLKLLTIWIRQLIAPGTWQDDESGEVREPSVTAVGACRIENGKLVIVHRDDVQFEVLCFCERLRIARGSQSKRRILADRVQLGCRQTRVDWKRHVVNLRATQEKTLPSLLTALERQVSISFLVDWAALQQAGWSPRDTMTFYGDQMPLNTALQQLLEQRGLTYHVVDEGTIEITTPVELAQRLETEVYPLGQMENQAAVDLGQSIIQRLGAANFQPVGRNAIGFDAVSRSLLVTANPTQQRQIEEIIAARVAVRP